MAKGALGERVGDEGDNEPLLRFVFVPLTPSACDIVVLLLGRPRPPECRCCSASEGCGGPGVLGGSALIL